MSLCKTLDTNKAFQPQTEVPYFLETEPRVLLHTREGRDLQNVHPAAS